MSDAPVSPQGPRPYKRVWPKLFIALAILAGAAALGIPGILQALREPPGVNLALQSLMTIATAQAHYRSHPEVNGGKAGYWRDDVAGLYGSKGSDGQPIRLIELAVAEADDRPRTDLSAYGPRQSKRGYRFRSLLYADEKSAAPDRFAVVAIPEDMSSGRSLFLITEEGKSFKRKPGHPTDVPNVCPVNPEAAGWQKMD